MSSVSREPLSPSAIKEIEETFDIDLQLDPDALAEDVITGRCSYIVTFPEDSRFLAHLLDASWALGLEGQGNNRAKVVWKDPEGHHRFFDLSEIAKTTRGVLDVLNDEVIALHTAPQREIYVFFLDTLARRIVLTGSAVSWHVRRSEVPDNLMAVHLETVLDRILQPERQSEVVGIVPSAVEGGMPLVATQTEGNAVIQLDDFPYRVAQTPTPMLYKLPGKTNGRCSFFIAASSKEDAAAAFQRYIDDEVAKYPATVKTWYPEVILDDIVAFPADVVVTVDETDFTR